MAECIVLRDYLNWKKGDHIEAFDSRLTELIENGIVQMIEPDPVEEPREQPKRYFEKKVK